MLIYVLKSENKNNKKQNQKITFIFCYLAENYI